MAMLLPAGLTIVKPEPNIPAELRGSAPGGANAACGAMMWPRPCPTSTQRATTAIHISPTSSGHGKASGLGVAPLLTRTVQRHVVSQLAEACEGCSEEESAATEADNRAQRRAGDGKREQDGRDGQRPADHPKTGDVETIVEPQQQRTDGHRNAGHDQVWVAKHDHR